MNWSTIVCEGNLSEDFLEEHAEYMDWTILPEKQQLTESFIEKHSKKWDWKDISIHQKLSFPFIMKHLERLDISYTLQNREITDEQATILLDEKKRRKLRIMGGNPMHFDGVSLKIKESITYWSYTKKIIQVQTNNNFTHFPPSHNITIEIILHESNDEEDYFNIFKINDSGIKRCISFVTEREEIDNDDLYEEYCILLEAVNRFSSIAYDLKYPYFARI